MEVVLSKLDNYDLNNSGPLVRISWKNALDRKVHRKHIRMPVSSYNCTDQEVDKMLTMCIRKELHRDLRLNIPISSFVEFWGKHAHSITSLSLHEEHSVYNDSYALFHILTKCVNLENLTVLCHTSNGANCLTTFTKYFSKNKTFNSIRQVTFTNCQLFEKQVMQVLNMINAVKKVFPYIARLQIMGNMEHIIPIASLLVLRGQAMSFDLVLQEIVNESNKIIEFKKDSVVPTMYNIEEIKFQFIDHSNVDESINFDDISDCEEHWYLTTCPNKTNLQLKLTPILKTICDTLNYLCIDVSEFVNNSEQKIHISPRNFHDFNISMPKLRHLLLYAKEIKVESHPTFYSQLERLLMDSSGSVIEGFDTHFIKECCWLNLKTLYTSYIDYDTYVAVCDKLRTLEELYIMRNECPGFDSNKVGTNQRNLNKLKELKSYKIPLQILRSESFYLPNIYDREKVAWFQNTSISVH